MKLWNRLKNSPRAKGWLQLVGVLLFVGFAPVISGLMRTTYDPVGTAATGERIFQVETTTVAPQPYRKHFTTTGVIAPSSSVSIVPEVSGRLVDVSENSFAGGRFQAGETLIQIDPRDFELAVRRIEADVARAATQLELARAETAAASAEWRERNGDRPVPDLVARIPQLKEAQATLESAEAQLETARLNLERTRINLPKAGRVLSSDAAEGGYAVAGQPLATVFYDEQLEIEVSLTETEAAILLSSTTPQIDLSYRHNGEKISAPGKLLRSVISIDPSTRLHNLRFGFVTPQPVLLGTFVEIRVSGDATDGIATLPLSAIQLDGEIWAVDSNDRLQDLDLKVFFRTEDHLAVRGLTGRTRIVTSRLNGPTADSRVNPQPTQAE